LRKIAEGLGDLKNMKFQSRENSVEKESRLSPLSKIKGLHIKAPTL
jgi:hypothetical protein